jgi:hypothetical protein
MVVVPMKEVKLVVVVDILDFEIKDVAFEANVLNRYGIFDQIANRGIEDPSYTYLHCDLLDKATLIIIILRVKLPYIEMHEQHLQKNMFVRVEIWPLSENLKEVLKRLTCMLSSQLS